MLNRLPFIGGLCLLCMALLQGCQTTSQPVTPLAAADALQQGKQDFKQGNYPVAYRELKPLADQGNPDAQYALGYMNYYGLGTPVDRNQAITWMQKAAAQHQLAASQAMAEFNKQLIASTTPVARPTAMSTTTPILRPASGLQNLADDRYVLQIMGSHDYHALQQLIHEENLAAPQILHRSLKGQDWYVLIAGNYASHELALQAASALRAQDPNLQPWIRQVSALKQTLA